MALDSHPAEAVPKNWGLYYLPPETWVKKHPFHNCEPIGFIVLHSYWDAIKADYQVSLRGVGSEQVLSWYRMFIDGMCWWEEVKDSLTRIPVSRRTIDSLLILVPPRPINKA